MKMEQLEKRILEELSVENAFKHTEWLTNEVGERISGSPEAQKAANYIKENLEKYGVPTELYEFEAYNSFPIGAELKVLSPEQKVIECQVQCHIASTLPEGIEAELVYVGAGGEEDYKEKDVKGKIVLVELSYAPPRPEKARIALKEGATGLIIMNWGTAEHRVLPMGAIKTVWGNPTPETFKEIPQIPMVGITRAAGEYLHDLCRKGTVRVWMRAEATREWSKIVQPIGRIKGKQEPEKFVIVSGHFDAWGKAATCNGAGNGIMLELARVFSKYKDQLRRSIVFAFWNGHEIAEAAGSTWYVDTFWDDVAENAIAYINIDSPGMKGTKGFQGRSSSELKQFHLDTERRILKEETTHLPIRGKTGDQSFYGVGIPSLAGRTVFDFEEIERLHGATLGWWYHSNQDDMDKIDIEALKRTMRVQVGYIIGLCNAPILPIEFMSVADDILSGLKELEPHGKGIIDLASLIEKAEELRIQAEKLREFVEKLQTKYGEKLEEKKEVVKTINECLMKLSRILTHVTKTVTGKYSQDSYGLSILERLIPILYPIVTLSKPNSKEIEYKLLKTKLMRERNKVSDALRDAIGHVKNTIEKIEISEDLS